MAFEDCPICFRVVDIGYDPWIMRHLYELHCARHDSDVVVYYAKAPGEDIVETVRRFSCWGCRDCPLADYDNDGNVVPYRAEWHDVKGA